MCDRNEKRFHGLTAQRSPGAVRHRSGNHQWNFLSGLFKDLRNGKERGFGVERVENGFDQQKIDISFEQGLGLIEISLFELIKRDGAESRIVYIWRHRRRHGKGPYGSRNKPASSCLIRNALRSAAGDFSSRQIYLAHEGAKIGIVHDALEKFLILATTLRFAGKKEIVQPDGGRTERVGLDDVGASFEVLRVDFLDDFRLRQKKKVEAALEIFTSPIAKPFSAIIGLRKFVTLDHRAHGAVEHDDAFAQKRFQRMQIGGRHDCPGTKRRFPSRSRNKLTHHDA